jgi:anti-sigma factor RsiW
MASDERLEKLSEKSFVESAKGERVGAYVDGELPPSEREGVEELLRKEPECRDVAENARWLDQLAGRERPPLVTVAEWARVKEAVLERAKTRRGRRGPVLAGGGRLGSRARALVPALSVAALVLIGIFIGFVGSELFLGTRAPPGASREGGTLGPSRADRDAVKVLEGPEPEVSGREEGAVHLDYQDF